MKKLHHIALLSFIGASISGHAQTAQVQIAGSSFPVKFNDTNLSIKAQQRIASDLTTLFLRSSSFDDLKDKEVETGVFQLTEKTMFLWKERESVFLVDQNNQKSIRVDKPLSVKYLKTFKWMDANTNTVQKAHEFVAMLNSPDLPSKPAHMLLNLVHFEPLSDIEENNPPSDIEIQTKFTEDYFPLQHLPVSAQSFYFEKIPELDDVEIPLFLLFSVDKLDPLKTSIRSIGFYKGKWGFGRFPFP